MFFMKDGVYQFCSRKLKEAHQWCFEMCKEYLTLGEDVVVANTFTTMMELRPYLFIGAHTTIYKMMNQFKSIHDVPDATIEKMKARWEDCSGEIEIKI